MPTPPYVPALTGITITAGAVDHHHFIIDQHILVDSALQSLAVTNPSLSVDAKHKFVYLSPHEDHTPQVSVVSGCGSGHEPSFAGFVGHGLLSAAVSGGVLSTPRPDQIQAMLERVDGRNGILAVIMNHPGDVANFKEAIVNAKKSGVKVQLVIVKDDVSMGRIESKTSGRSGIAGTVLVLKIAGALAATGAPLEEVTRVAQLTADHLLSVGASLSHVEIPNHPVADPLHDEYLATERLGPATGLGEHHLPGSRTLAIDLPGIVTKLLQELLDWRDEDRAFVPFVLPAAQARDGFVLLVNNLGGLSGMELGAITLEIVRQLERTYAVRPVHVYSGRFMSSLNELGFSISLLRTVDLTTAAAGGMLALLDAAAETTGWPATIRSELWREGRRATTTAGLPLDAHDAHGDEIHEKEGPGLDSGVSGPEVGLGLGRSFAS